MKITIVWNQSVKKHDNIVTQPRGQTSFILKQIRIREKEELESRLLKVS